jgi:hypothetical protein
VRIARIAEDEQADALVIGTELGMTSKRPEWLDLIASARAGYSRTLLYVSHNADEAEAVPSWDRLDAVAVSLYPPLGADDDRAGRQLAMRAVGDRLDALAARTGKSIVVEESGLRSARGAAAKPWESAEERGPQPIHRCRPPCWPIGCRRSIRPTMRGAMIWGWFTGPDAGGPADTDCTVQGKPAERPLMCAWTAACAKP